MSQPRAGYSTSQIVLHWLIAALVLFQLVFGESMETFVDAATEGEPLSRTDQTLGWAHYWVGLAILVLAFGRLAIRLVAKAPKLASAGPAWIQHAVRASHALFYVLLVATPVLGLLGFYLGDPWSDIHTLNKPVFVGLIAVHAVAALYHQYWLRDGTLKRMILPSGRRVEAANKKTRSARLAP